MTTHPIRAAPPPATCRSGTATRRSLALGGSRPLPEQFEAADTRFDLSERTLRPVMEAVAREVDVPTA